MPKYVFFLRVSTVKQTLESQFSDLFTFASKFYQLTEEDIIPIKYKESGRKLSEEERVGIKEFKEHCEAGEDIRSVFIWETSRLSRKRIVTDSFIEYLQAHHIQLICQNPFFELFNTETWEKNPSSDIVLNIFISLAEQESIETSLRFRRGKRYLAENGRYNGGAIPYGYKIDPSQDNLIVVDEDVEAPIVREVFNLYEQGKSQAAIAKEMFERGVKGRAARRTKSFTISLVHQLLTNELLTGKKHLSKGASFERQYPQIITPEQFERCRKIATANNTKLPKSNYIHYAHGLIKCLTCGRNFVSTGNKGYYRCRDAYNYNKKYDGYFGEPMCDNKVCISNNIMDSLLWELTKDYESTYIVNEASQELSDCRKKKEILQKKIEAIPARLAELEGKRQRYISAYAEGWDEEKYRTSKLALGEEIRKVRASESEYRAQLAHLDVLINDIENSMALNYDLQTEEGIENFVDYSDRVWNRVASITDDSERCRLIHKHIEKVTVSVTTVNYQFDIHPEGKDAFAKEIVVYPYLFKPRTFYFIPYNGKGGIMLQKNESAGKTIHVSGLKDFVVPPYSVFQMEYLVRVVDEGKRRRRAKAKEERVARENEAILALRKKGYISMNEMMQASRLSYSTLYRAIKSEKLKGKNLFKTWYVKKADFEQYLYDNSPKPRPKVVNQSSDGKSAEQRLLDAIMHDVQGD